MLPNIEEMEEFVKEIPKTPEGKLEALNKFFLKEKKMVILSQKTLMKTLLR